MPRRDVPELDGAVVARSDEPIAIAAELAAPHDPGVARERGRERAGLDVPDLDDAVRAADHDLMILARRIDVAADDLCAVIDRPEALASREIPDEEHAIGRRGDDPIGANHRRAHADLVRRDRLDRVDELAVARVPQPERPIEARRQDPPVVRREHRVRDLVGVAS